MELKKTSLNHIFNTLVSNVLNLMFQPTIACI